MNEQWTEALSEPLSRLSRYGNWCRVEEGRHGGWLLLSDRGSGDVHWFHSDGHAAPTSLNPLDDEELPQIERLVRRWLEMGYGFRLLAWRVHRRAIFRVFTNEGTKICKVYRKDRAIHERWQALPSTTSPWRVPCVLNWDARERILDLEDCEGTSLNRRWLTGAAIVDDGERVADLLDWIQSQPASEQLPAHTAEDEARLLSGRLEAFDRTLRRPPGAAHRLVDRVIHALLREERPAAVLSHRDFHDKQILFQGREGGCLIDLDLVARAEPALDVGNILAHLRLRALKTGAVPWRGIGRSIAERAVRSRSIADSLPRWTASALLRLALIYSRRQRSVDLLPRLLESAEQALGADGEWADILNS